MLCKLPQVIGSSSGGFLPERQFGEFDKLRRVSCRRRLSKISGKEVICIACGPIRTWTGTRARGRNTWLRRGPPGALPALGDQSGRTERAQPDAAEVARPEGGDGQLDVGGCRGALASPRADGLRRRVV